MTMRLVDADALQQHFTDMQHYERCACNFMDDGGEPATEWYCVEDALDNAPTIDAIPVEWLKEFDLYYAGISGGTKYMNELVEAWQREQEAQG
jgi:hypothetical protein